MVEFNQDPNGFTVEHHTPANASQYAGPQPFVPLQDADHEAPPKPLDVNNPADLDGKPVPPRRWIVPGVIPEGVPTLLAGDSGIGKTLLALQLCASVSSTGLWLGYETKRGGALLFTAEDDDDELHRRLDDVASNLGVSLADLGEGGLRVRSLVDDESTLAFPMDKRGAVVPTPLWLRIEMTIAELRPVLVVIDPLSNIFASNENDRVECQRFVNIFKRACRKYGCTIILTAHPSRAGLANGTGESGSTGWKAAVRSFIYMRYPKGDKETIDPDQRVLEHMKGNYSAKGSEQVIRWQRGAFTVGPKTEEATFGAPTKAERVLLEMLASYTANGRHVSAQPSANYLPTVFSKDARAFGVTMSAFRDAMNRLFERQEITTDVYGPRSKERRCVIVSPDAGKGRA
ncbi:MAG: ATPase [Mesorhizobium amorphae]|nr:MAG: ATPase [Mesorhizobium amorphae]